MKPIKGPVACQRASVCDQLGLCAA